MGSPTVPNTCKDARLCLGQGSGERGIRKTYPGSSAHPPPFRARELEQWHENACSKASCSKGHQWGSCWGGVSLGDRLISKLHEQADSCRCCVELGHLVLVHNAPHAAHVRVCGDTLKLTQGRLVISGPSQQLLHSPTVPQAQ